MFIPVIANLLIEPIEKTGIVTTVDTPAEIIKGKVISTGAECIEVSENDIVHYKRGSAREIELEDKKYHVVEEEDVIVYEPAETEDIS